MQKHVIEIPEGQAFIEEASSNEHNKAVALSLDDAVRINDAAKKMGCTAESLLREAASSKRLLYVAIKPHSATLSAIPGYANPRQCSRTTKAHSIVAMLPNYAESLVFCGSADISQFQAGFVPPLDGLYWMLTDPQTVGIDSVFVSRADVHTVDAVPMTQRGGENVEDASRASAEKPLARQLHQEQEIMRIIRELGHEPDKLPKNGAGKPGVKAEVRGKLAFTDVVFNKAWERLRNSGEIQDVA